MNKFKYLVTFGLKKRVWRKAFIITNAILGIAILLIVNIPALIDIFGPDHEQPDPFQVIVINDTTDQTYDLSGSIDTYINNEFIEDSYEIKGTTYEDSDDFWDDEDVDILLIFSGDLQSPDIDMYIKPSHTQSHLVNNIQRFLNDYQGIEYANFNLIEPDQNGEDDNGRLAPEDRMFIEGIVSILFLPMFMLIVFATQFLGVDIIEEKSSKAIETIIASVPAKVHFLSKITASVGFLFIQGSLLIIYGLLGAGLGRMMASTVDTEALSLFAELSTRIPDWPILLVLAILFMLVGTVLFLTLSALIASIATTQEDYQQFQAPLVLILISGFYIGIFLPMMGADNLIKIASFIPLFSPFVGPIAFATGVTSLWHALVSLLILMLTVILFMYLISPIYKVAILSYEETKFFRRIGRYIKKAFSKKTT